MNENERRINEFLLFFRDLAKQNKDFELTKTAVYARLTRLGVQERVRLKENFPVWEAHYKKNPRCECFVSPVWEYFCQFISKDKTAFRSAEHLKVYVPLDARHIQNGAKMIFDFLSKEKISHLSKIGSDARFDDIVIRLVNPKDLTKLLNFLKKNKYIQEGLMPGNPFTFSQDGIAMAVDGSLSFNETIAYLISLYINDKTKTQTLDTVNVNDFYNFIEKYYQKVFSSASGLETLYHDFPDREDPDFTLDKVVNYRNIFELIMKAHKKNFTLDDYIAHYLECSNSRIQTIKMNEIRSISEEPKQREELKKCTDVDGTLIHVINNMLEKGLSYEGIVNGLNAYLTSGNGADIRKYIDQDKMVFETTFREDLLRILNNQNISFFDYTRNLWLRKNENKQDNQNISSDDYAKINRDIIMGIKDILTVMTNKYGKEEARDSLEFYILSGDKTYLTRTDNLRDRIINSSFRENVNEMLNRRQLNVHDYIDIVMEEIVGCDKEYLNQAIMETYDKYEKLYQDGQAELDGHGYAYLALLQLLNEKDYRGFTRSNGARANLENNLSIEDVKRVVSSELQIEDISQLSPAEIRDFAREYIDMVLDNNKRKNR